MSSTQMDFSLIGINRKQDTTSWPEEDITKLAPRDQSRYQKRKSAIIEYFSTEHSVEEISSHHRLSSSESLETLARRCLALHEDGRPWGFRALVPGVRVIDHVEPARHDATDAVDAPDNELSNGHLNQHMTEQEALEEDDTAEHRAIISTDFTDLPQTPVPEAHEAEKTEAEEAELAVDEKENLVETVAMSQASAEIEVPTEAAEEEKPESLPAVSEAVPEAELEEVEQEDFPVALENTTEMENKEEEVEQEDFPVIENTPIVEQGEEEAKQEDFPTVESVPEVKPDEEVEQEDFPAVEGAVVAVREAEVEQEEFPEPVAGVSGGAEKEEDVEQEEILVAEVAQEEEGEQEDLPTAEVVIEAAQEEEEGSQEEPLTEENVAEGVQEQESEAGEEPTAKLGDPAVQEKEEQEDSSAVAEEADAEPTGKLADLTREDSSSDLEQTEAGESAVAEEENAPAGTAEEDEMDTAEVARVEAEKRRDRMAAADTVIVPVALLEALEKADRELVAETETVETSAITSAKAVAEDQDEESSARPATADSTPGDDVAIEAMPTRTLEELRRDSQQLALAEVKTPTQSLAGESRYQITGSQAALRHSVRRRWGKQGRQQQHRRWVKIVSAAVIVSILVILLIPLCVGLVGYNAYTNIKGVANDGVAHLMAIKDLLPANKNDIMSALNAQKLTQANTELGKAESDFLQLQDMVNRPDIESLLQQWAPQYSGKLDMARRLVQVALDVSRMGQELIGVAQMGAGIVHGGSLLSSSSNKPLLTAADISSVEAALVHGQYYINDISTQMSQVNLAQVPFGSASQKAQIGKYLQLLPQAQGMINQLQGLIGPVSWLLGIGQTRHFLVQTLDRGELRPSGGFEGQYGVLTLQNGRMSPFTLKDITGLDYAGNGAELGATPPPQYSWMNFGFFGVRDANLSADFPTTAQIVMNYFQREGGGPVDGDIQITPVVIEQLLQVTGPLHVSEYNETITAQNLEQKLHAYQQDPRLIAEQQQKTGTDTHSTRKAFTNLVGSMLLDRAKHLQMAQLIDFGKLMLKDLKSRDLQVYFTNPVAEQWLTQNDYSGSMPKFTNGTDGFMVVQANISISKAAQYVRSTFNDQVTLDANGGATHNLTITLNYQQTGPVYGYNSYADYLRVYAPASAQFISGYGFNSGQTLCTPNKPKMPTPGTGGTGGNNGGKGNKPGGGSGSSGTAGSYTDAGMVISGCANYYHSYPDTTNRYCPDGNYQLGYDGMQAKAWPIQALGAPTQTSSDLPGYKMWGGLTLTPKNCTSTITLSWYVPHVVQSTAGQPPYQMIVGHQAGWPVTAQISVDTSALKGVKSFKYNQTINVDTVVALPARPLPPSQQKPTTPTPAVTPTATPKKP